MNKSNNNNSNPSYDSPRRHFPHRPALLRSSPASQRRSVGRFGEDDDIDDGGNNSNPSFDSPRRHVPHRSALLLSSPASQRRSVGRFGEDDDIDDAGYKPETKTDLDASTKGIEKDIKENEKSAFFSIGNHRTNRNPPPVKVGRIVQLSSNNNVAALSPFTNNNVQFMANVRRLLRSREEEKEEEKYEPHNANSKDQQHQAPSSPEDSTEPGAFCVDTTGSRPRAGDAGLTLSLQEVNLDDEISLQDICPSRHCVESDQPFENSLEVTTAFMVEDDDEEGTNHADMEDQVRRQILKDTVHAQAVNMEGERKRMLISTFFVFLIVVGLVAGLVLGITTQKTMMVLMTQSPSMVPSASPSMSPSTIPPTVTWKPTLENLQENGMPLKCGVRDHFPGWSMLDPETDTMVGFEPDLCRAVAAAVFGDADFVEYVTFPALSPLRFNSLANQEIDLLLSATSIDMKRRVFDEDLGQTFAFSTPWLYDGMSFGGTSSDMVNCADQTDNYFGECRNLQICVCEDCPYRDVLEDIFSSRTLVFMESYPDGFEKANEGECNVVAGPKGVLANIARSFGMSDNFKMSANFFSHRTLSLVTRGDDPQWSDFVEFILQAIFAAEEMGVTQATASSFMPTDVFGELYSNMFINALSAVGNYAEIHDRNMKDILPRKDMNFINTGTNGVIYSHPFGNIAAEGRGPEPGGILEAIIERGQLYCGIIRNFGFGETSPISDKEEYAPPGWREEESVYWSGMDADFCRALAASIVGPSTEEKSNVVFVDVTSSDSSGYEELHNGLIDVLAGAEPTFLNDVMEPTTGQGFSFTQSYFYYPKELNRPPKALAVRQDDIEWCGFTYAVVTSIFFAEEHAIKSSSSDRMPEVNLYGPDLTNMFRNAISACGNYAEIYDSNLADIIPRDGTRNELNFAPFGPQHIPRLTF